MSSWRSRRNEIGNGIRKLGYQNIENHQKERVGRQETAHRMEVPFAPRRLFQARSSSSCGIVVVFPPPPPSIPSRSGVARRPSLLHLVSLLARFARGRLLVLLCCGSSLLLCLFGSLYIHSSVIPKHTAQHSVIDQMNVRIEDNLHGCLDSSCAF